MAFKKGVTAEAVELLGRQDGQANTLNSLRTLERFIRQFPLPQYPCAQRTVAPEPQPPAIKPNVTVFTIDEPVRPPIGSNEDLGLARETNKTITQITLEEVGAQRYPYKVNSRATRCHGRNAYHSA